MKILAYRTVAICYPWLSLEVKIQRENGTIVYYNMGVNDKEETMEEVFEDNMWAYKVPLDEVDFNDVDKYYDFNFETDRNENDEFDIVGKMLLELWNMNPVFKHDLKWKVRECAYGCEFYGYTCCGNPYITPCNSFEETEMEEKK